MKILTSKQLTRFLCAGDCRCQMKLFMTCLWILASAVAPHSLRGATFRAWTGNASGLWSNPNNWVPVGVPETGDFLTFDAKKNTAMTNDLLNLAIAGFSFDNFDSYILEGNPLRIGEGVPRLVGAYGLSGDFINCPLILSGDVTLEASTQIGWLNMTTNINLNGHNLTLSGHSIWITGSISGDGNVEIADGYVYFAGTSDNTFTGTLVVDGGSPYGHVHFDKDAGSVVFGRLELRNGAVVDVDSPHQIGNDTAVSILDGSQLLFHGNTETIGSLSLTNSSGSTNASLVDTGGSTLSVLGNIAARSDVSDVVPTIAGILGLPPGLHEFQIGEGASLFNLLVNARVVGAGELRKTGIGQMWLTASNDYSGITTVDGGSLVAFNADALGASGTGTTVHSGASLILNAPNSTVPEPIAIAGPGDGAHGALEVLGSVTLRNPFPSIFACLDLTSAATIRVEQGGVCTIDGFVSGVGPLTKTGSGTLVFSNANANTYSGDTIVSEGVLNLSKPSFAVAVPGNLTVGPAPLNSSAIARWSTSGGMNPSAIATVNAGSLLDLNGNGLSLSRLNLNDGGDAQTGAGQLNFATFGMLAVGSLNQLGSHAGSTFSGNIGLSANGTLTFAVNGYAPTAPFDFNPELIVAANIPAPAENPNFERAGIAKTGAGAMRLFGNTTFNGRIEVLGGTFIAGNGTSFGSSFDGTFVMNNAKLALEGHANFNDEILVLNSTATPALENLTGENWWNGPVIMNRDSIISISAAGHLHIDGVISGAANLTKTGPGKLTIGGVGNNTYSGETSINEGVLQMTKPLAITAVPGALNIGTSAGLPATVANLTSYQIVGDIFVNRGGLLNLNGQVENVDHLWLSEGGDVDTSIGVLSVKTGGSINVLPGASSDPSTISGKLEFLAGAHTINVAASTSSSGEPDLNVTANVTSSGGLISLQKTGTGKLRLSANNAYPGSVVVHAGSLQVDGSQPTIPVSVLSDARLMGNGSAGAIAFLGPSAFVAPGASPGLLTVGDFNVDGFSGGTLNIELDGNAPTSQYDQLLVHGIVNLDTTTLQLAVNFNPGIGDQFMIIVNDLADAVIGTFNGLPQGASLTLGDNIFQIDYSGGDGNDVVLTKTAEVYHPLLTIQQLSPASVRLVWPTNDPAFSLQFATNMTATNSGDWSPLSESRVLSGTNWMVTNSINGTVRYYRLAKP